MDLIVSRPTLGRAKDFLQRRRIELGIVLLGLESMWSRPQRRWRVAACIDCAALGGVVLYTLFSRCS